MNSKRAAAVLWMLLANGCGEPESTGPPEIRLGLDDCAECRMILSDERFAAALVLRDEHGRLQKLLFDDLGCLLVHRGKTNPPEGAAEYVKDYTAGDWLELEQATLVHAPELHSPMGFAVAACGSPAAARALSQRKKGEIISLNEFRSDPNALLPAGDR